MSNLEEHQCDAQVKNMSKKKTPQKTLSLLDYVRDPKREESLIGMQYVVEIKMLESDKSIVKCNLCGVKGQMATMKEHLVGTNHIKVYMEKYYLSVLQSLKGSCHHKVQFARLLKDYAKEIERAEGNQGVKIEYVSAADMKKEQDNWISEQEERMEYHAEQKRFQVLDKRQMALNYSEKFKISSWEEATIVLNLTQQLSDQLEQYFLKYKGLDVLDSSVPNSISTESTPATTNFFPNVYENLYQKSAADQGLKSVTKEMQWHTEEPSSSSVCTPTSVHSFDSVPVKLEDTRRLKRKHEMFEDASNGADVHSESSTTSEFHSRKKRLHKELEHFPIMHSSSFSYMNDMGSPQHSSAPSHSSSIAATYMHISIPKEKSCVPETFDREMQMINHIPENSISQNILNDHISKAEAVQEVKSLDTAETYKLGAEKHTAVPGLSTSASNCSYEPSSERPSSSHTHGRTSKNLSPDILQLLKGKDANTVTNILRTLSPFYPALQDINLEILAQVLVNTGALD